MKIKNLIIALLCPLALVTCRNDEEGPLNPRFSLNMHSDLDEATVDIENTTTGATEYSWLFPGGNPSTSHEKNPAAVTYTENGKYKISLAASNGLASKTKTVEITVAGIQKSTSSQVRASFAVNMVLDQKKATVDVTNNSTGAEAYEWLFPGGNPAKSTKKAPGTVTYKKNGTYKITLKALKGKKESSRTATITVSGIK